MLRERRSNANISQSTVHKPKRREGSLPESRESTQLTINFTGDVESNISGIVDCLECSHGDLVLVAHFLKMKERGPVYVLLLGSKHGQHGSVGLRPVRTRIHL